MEEDEDDDGNKEEEEEEEEEGEVEDMTERPEPPLYNNGACGLSCLLNWSSHCYLCKPTSVITMASGVLRQIKDNVPFFGNI